MPGRASTSTRARAVQRAGTLVAVATLFCKDVEAAEPARPSYRLLWVRGDEASSCPPPSAVARGVEERLGYDPFSADARATIEAHVDRSGGVWQVTLRFPSGSSDAVKRFESGSADCGAVAQAAELAIGLAIKTNETNEEARDERGTPPVPPAADHAHESSNLRAAATETRAPLPPDGPPPKPAPAPLEGLIAVSGVGAVGLLPQAAIGLDARGLVRLQRAAYLSLGMSHFPEVPADDPSFRLGTTLGRFGACVDPTRSARPRLVGCGHVELGNTVVVVRELTPTAPGSRIFGAVSAGLLFVQPWRPFALLVEANAMVPVPAYDFILSGTGRTIYSSPFVTGFLRVGLGFGSF
jgi:hypothetical protein